MKKLLIVKPCFSIGNVGDAALIKTIVSLHKSDEIFIPQTKNELNNIDSKLFDTIIYFGNDCVAYYMGGVPIKQIKEFLNANKKVHIINTSWGNNPSNESIEFLKSVANNPNFQIYMRDKYSHELIQKNIKFHNTPILTADLAFLCKKNTSKKVDKLEEWINKNDKPIIGINTHYDFKDFNRLVRIGIKKFITNNKNKYRFLFIPHDSRKNEYKDLQLLCKSCKDIDGYTTKYLDPEYEKYMTSKLYLVITGRMHLSILTIPNNIPAIAIAYNGVKAKGTFQHWGLEDFVIEPKNINILNDKVKYVEDNYETIQNKLVSKQKHVKELAYKQILC